MTAAEERRAELLESWKTVRIVEAMIQANTGGNIFSLIPNMTGFSRVPESLLLLFAVSVLEEALKCLRIEGVFHSRDTRLDSLMKASKTIIPWQDFAAIDQIRLRRNHVAHQRIFLVPGQCHVDLAAISKELLAWKVLASDFKGEYQVSFGGDA